MATMATRMAATTANITSGPSIFRSCKRTNGISIDDTRLTAQALDVIDARNRVGKSSAV